MNDELSFVDRLILSDELYEALRLIKQAIAEGSEKGLEARVIADA